MKRFLTVILSALLLCSCAEQIESKNPPVLDETEVIEETVESDILETETETAETSTETEITVAAEEKTEKDMVYDTLTANKDILSSNEVLGIALVDLDFDNTPELIVSKYFAHEYEAVNNPDAEPQIEYLVNADVYRIRDDALVYIDTLYNFNKIVYQTGNILGLKTLENGDKAWFTVSYKNRFGDKGLADYLFTLEGDELKFTEVFYRENESGDPFNSEGIFRVFGEEMVITETEYLYDEYMLGDYERIHWGDYASAYGKGILFVNIKQDYCSDMTETTVKLYSDWLIEMSDINGAWYFSEPVKLTLNDSEFDANINMIAENFYSHGNDALLYDIYYYEFVGAFAKPVIYLYPEEATDVNVQVTFPSGGNFTCTYPEYNNGWNVTAFPDGTLINKTDGREYSYLYWEGEGSAKWDFSSGFVVKGEDTASFLQEKLTELGLKPREYNEFIVYWLPLMQDNAYNLITFQTAAYEENVKLYVSPEPDSVLRVFMAYMPLENPIDIPEQQIDTFERTGFSVIEWGGTCVK